MIFVCTGTQVYQFDRLIKKLDELVENGVIKDRIFAQIGSSTYIPKNYEYKAFLSADEFKEYQDQANLIISHGGTGALIGASKKGKNIIAVPRLSEYGEHTDNHQLQIVEVLEREGYIRAVYNIEDLADVIESANKEPITKIYSRPSNILEILEDFIDKSVKEVKRREIGT